MSGLPYKFERGMDTVWGDGTRFHVVHVRDDGAVGLLPDGRFIVEWSQDPQVIADLDHAGTRGLLLAQYREASGHEHASLVYDDGDGEWLLVVGPRGQEGELASGASEGSAILDALTRLAAEREAEVAPQPMTPAELANRLERIEKRLRKLEDGHR